MNITEIDGVGAYELDKECYNCGKSTNVLWPVAGELDSDLGEVLAESEDTPVTRAESRSLGSEVWGNECEHCGRYQGNQYVQQLVDEEEPPVVECPHCGDDHEWHLDQGMGAAVGQGWIECPEIGPIPKGRPESN